METEPRAVTWRDLFEVLASELEKGTPEEVLNIPVCRLVPLYWAPLLFCGTPGDPNKLPTDKTATGRCMEQWATAILDAAQQGELWARDPDSWMPLNDREPITPRALIGWRELDDWAMHRFGLSAGSYDPRADLPPIPEDPPHREARIIPYKRPERIRDDWTEFLIAAIEDHEAEQGETGTEAQIWSRIASHPPKGYRCEWDDAQKGYRMPDNPPLTRVRFKERFKRLYPDARPAKAR